MSFHRVMPVKRILPPRFAANEQRLISEVAALLRAEIDNQKISTRQMGQLTGLLTNHTVVRVTNGYDSKLSTLSDIATALGKRIRITLEDDKEP